MPSLARTIVKPFKTQLLKWIGNKQRFAEEIISYFPHDYNIFFEPFLGSGAVLGTLKPDIAVASDNFQPLMEIWITLKNNPNLLKSWYRDRWLMFNSGDKKTEYERIKTNYNTNPNGADLLFLSRSCYGGVMRFRKSDGYMSTPIGVHNPISPESFDERVDIWYERTRHVDFVNADFRETMARAREGDLIYCDPPYSDSQGIIYGAQNFRLVDLLDYISTCKDRGVRVVLSIDGKKKSGRKHIELPIPEGLFEREIYVNVGRSMLKRFQMEGNTLEDEHVHDRLLLTY